MGIDWWMTNSYLCSTAGERANADQLARLNERIAKLEESAVPSNLRI